MSHIKITHDTKRLSINAQDIPHNTYFYAKIKEVFDYKFAGHLAGSRIKEEIPIDRILWRMTNGCIIDVQLGNVWMSLATDGFYINAKFDEYEPVHVEIKTHPY